MGNLVCENAPAPRIGSDRRSHTGRNPIATVALVSSCMVSVSGLVLHLARMHCIDLCTEFRVVEQSAEQLEDALVLLPTTPTGMAFFLSVAGCA